VLPAGSVVDAKPDVALGLPNDAEVAEKGDAAGNDGFLRYVKDPEEQAATDNPKTALMKLTDRELPEYATTYVPPPRTKACTADATVVLSVI
jgi:hypothetical protein